MTLIYKCLQCGKEFPAPSGKKDAKFCSNDPCYKDYRKLHGTKAVAEAKAIFIREEPYVRKPRTTKPKPQETDIAPPPLADPLPNEPITEKIDEEETNDDTDVINFNDLSINDLKEIISSLLISNEKLQSQVQSLSDEITRLENNPSPMAKIVSKFLTEIIKLEGGEISSVEPLIEPPRICAGEGCHNRLEGDKFFCSTKCAKSVLISPLSRMAMNDGTLIGVGL